MDIFSKRAPCGGWKMPREIYLGDPSHWVQDHSHIRVWKNTTVVPNPACIEACSPPVPCEPSTVPPYRRPSTEWCQDHFGAPGQEADLGCCSAKAGPMNPEPVNTYVESDPPEYVNRATCRKIGYKNVFAWKQWHGVFGPTAQLAFGRVVQTRGDGSCEIRGHALTPPLTKYRTLTVASTVDAVGVPDEYGGGSGHAYGSASSTSTVHRLSGLGTGSCTVSGTGGGSGGMYYSDEDMRNNAKAALGLGMFTVDQVYDYFLAKVAGMVYAHPSATLVFASGLTGTPTVSIDYYDYPSDPPLGNHIQISVSLELATGHYHYVQTIHGPREHAAGGGYFADVDEEISFAVTATESTCTYRCLTLTTQELNRVDYTTEVVATYSDPYSSDMVNQDVDAMIDSWKSAILDDAQYPWRVDGAWNQGPLVTRNESSNAPTIYAEPGTYTSGAVPRPERPAGDIIGLPNPAGFEPFFDFFHQTWEKLDVTEGITGEQWRVKEFGAYCPPEFPCATQWLDNRQSQFVPPGPFAAYSIFRNPTTYSTSGCPIIEFPGLMKCAWFEVIMFAVPSQNFARPCGPADKAAVNWDWNCAHAPTARWPGVPCHCDAPTVTSDCESQPTPSTEYVWNDRTKKGEYVFKSFVFDFRDWREAHASRKAAIGVSQREDCAGVTMTPLDTIRYIEDPAQWEGHWVEDVWVPGGGTIKSGSLWMKEANIIPTCIEYSHCSPAVAYCAPSDYDFAGSSVRCGWPNLTCDEAYGSLWMARIQQWMPDPLWQAPGTPQEIERLCDLDCASYEADDGSCLDDDELWGICYYPLPPFVEAVNSLPPGAPPLPADAADFFCTNIIWKLNQDPPIGSHPSCYPLYVFGLVWDPVECGGYTLYGEPAGYIPPWVTLLKMEQCVRSGGRFAATYRKNGIWV